MGLYNKESVWKQWTAKGTSKVDSDPLESTVERIQYFMMWMILTEILIG